MQVVREQIRKMALGGPQTEADKANLYEVSSSEDTQSEIEYRSELIDSTSMNIDPLEKPEGVSERICDALSRNQVFRGINQHLLQQVCTRVGVSVMSCPYYKMDVNQCTFLQIVDCCETTQLMQYSQESVP